MSERRARVIAVVGAGPVGCLAALSIAKFGCHVHVYEARPDMRLASSKANFKHRSVNLTISSRGLAALEFFDPAVAARFLESMIPMRGRVIHDSDGSVQVHPYDPDGQCINSMDRGLLNEQLLDEASAHDRITFHFQHKLVTADFHSRTLSLQDTSEGIAKAVEAAFDLCIGADGSYSSVRQQMMRTVSMNYSQEYIPHEYVELRIPPGPGSTLTSPNFVLDPNGLHVWPRHTFMLVAFPNKDASFTCTLFASRAELAPLRDRETILRWFQAYFPDTVNLIGEDELVRHLTQNPRNPLISIKANPYHYKDRVIILGDAAHSMVPFYGQGLNCGLEDVRLLCSMMISHGIDWSVPEIEGNPTQVDEKLAAALREYSDNRHEDLVTICDLSMTNYLEMRHSVTTRVYRAHKVLDFWLSRAFPSPRVSLVPMNSSNLRNCSGTAPLYTFPRGWLSLYTMVAFRPDIPYTLAKQKHEWQNAILSRAGWVLGSLAVLGITYGVYTGVRNRALVSFLWRYSQGRV